MSFIKSLKEVASTASKIKDPELMKQVLELQSNALIFQNDNAELRERIRYLEALNEELREKLLIQGDLSVKEGVYFLWDGEKESGPFCTRCWDVQKILVHIMIKRNEQAGCPECKTIYDYKFQSSAQHDQALTDYDPLTRRCR